MGFGELLIIFFLLLLLFPFIRSDLSVLVKNYFSHEINILVVLRKVLTLVSFNFLLCWIWVIDLVDGGLERRGFLK